MSGRFLLLTRHFFCLSTLLFYGCSGSESTSERSVSEETSGSSEKNDSAEQSSALPPVQSEPFGTTQSGEAITQYLLTNNNGISISVINYGAIVTAVNVPDRNGQSTNITLGFDNLQGYEGGDPYFGAICGRYANRIAKGKFSIDGKEYQLATNNAPNHLHGGIKGFNEVVWRGTPINEADSMGVELIYVSPDGEENYPGELKVTVRYTLNNNNEFKIHYMANSKQKTHINLTNHCYWNLAGSGSILDHELTLNCDRSLPVDATLIPTGSLKPVAGTPMDFTKAAMIGSRFAEVKGDDTTGGYDHCYVINQSDQKLTKAAHVYEPTSGRIMEVFTTEPGIQFYTGNFLDGENVNGGYQQHHGFCLECQHFPDSPNQPDFPNTLLEPGIFYTQETVHKFSVKQ